MIWTCAEEGQRLYLRKDAEDGRARQEAQKTKEVRWCKKRGLQNTR